MIKLLTLMFFRFREIILYGIIGCISSGFDFVVYTLLENVGLYYIFANCLSVLFGICTSFALNRKYNFKVTDHTGRRFAIFLTVGLTGMALSNILLYCCVEEIGLDKILSKALSIVIVVFFQFLLNKYITYRISKSFEI